MGKSCQLKKGCFTNFRHFGTTFTSQVLNVVHFATFSLSHSRNALSINSLSFVFISAFNNFYFPFLSNRLVFFFSLVSVILTSSLKLTTLSLSYFPLFPSHSYSPSLNILPITILADFFLSAISL